MLLILALALGAGQIRVAESVVPSLKYSSVCSTEVELKNLGDRAVDVRLEPRRESGSLVVLAEQGGLGLKLLPGQTKNLTLKIEEATDSAWMLVREIVPGAELSPVVAVSGKTGCAAGNELRSELREVAHPLTNPWFEGEVGEMAGARLSVVNTSEQAAVVTGCYSRGILVANPNAPGGSVLLPLCTNRFREEIPPFSAKQFPVEREGNSHFSLRATGKGVALQMLRPVDAGTQLYRVDSSISFGSDR